MAKIVNNTSGRRMIRLTAEDILTVVTVYRQQFNMHSPLCYEDLKAKLNQQQLYLPEEA